MPPRSIEARRGCRYGWCPPAEIRRSGIRRDLPGLPADQFGSVDGLHRVTGDFHPTAIFITLARAFRFAGDLDTT